MFVPAKGPGDALAQYRALILSRVRLFLIGVPILIGVLAGVVAQSYWMPVQLFLEGGDFGIRIRSSDWTSASSPSTCRSTASC